MPASCQVIRLSLLLTSLIAIGHCRADEPLEDLLSATFRIVEKDRSGTCFLMSGQAVNATDPRQVVLVTAAHVLEAMPGSKCDLILRMETEDQQFRRHVVSVPIRDGDKPLWTRLPEIDIASILITLPEGVSVKPISLDQIADETRLKDKAVRVGQEAWIGCFPAQLEANEAGWPVLRKGSIASHPLVPVKSHRTMLIDYNVFGGDSGAPIAVIVDRRPLIVAVASSMQRQTDKSSLPFEERTMHTPLGISIAVQAHYLRETLKRMVEK